MSQLVKTAANQNLMVFKPVLDIFNPGLRYASASLQNLLFPSGLQIDVLLQ